jgi:hypothetical protein
MQAAHAEQDRAARRPSFPVMQGKQAACVLRFIDDTTSEQVRVGDVWGWQGRAAASLMTPPASR